jgi:hypothetical protein
MDKVFVRIWRLTVPYLDTRQNAIHTAVSLSLAWNLLKWERGQEKIVIPAVILHDVGWSAVPEALQVTAFGPNATAPELNRRHETEGVRIAGKILRAVSYPHGAVEEILEIIGGHDSREAALSSNDKIVKDADRLWRFTRTGLRIDIERFRLTDEGGLDYLRGNLDRWLFTRTAKRMAAQELRQRREERGVQSTRPVSIREATVSKK